MSQARPALKGPTHSYRLTYGVCFSTSCRGVSPGASLSSQGACRAVARARPVTSHAAGSSTDAGRPARRGREAASRTDTGAPSGRTTREHGQRADAPGKRQPRPRPATTPMVPATGRAAGFAAGPARQALTHPSVTTLKENRPLYFCDRWGGGCAHVPAGPQAWQTRPRTPAGSGASTLCSWLRGLLLPSTFIPVPFLFSLSFFAPGGLCGRQEILFIDKRLTLIPDLPLSDQPLLTASTAGPPFCTVCSFVCGTCSGTAWLGDHLEGTAPQIPGKPSPSCPVDMTGERNSLGTTGVRDITPGWGSEWARPPPSQLIPCPHSGTRERLANRI